MTTGHVSNNVQYFVIICVPVGGLDDTLDGIINSCQEHQIPVVFALKRQLLGKVLLKKVPVSIVGIFNYDGAQVSKVQ